MRALVIGASGLVGSHLLAALAEAGDTPTGTYRAMAAPGLSPLDIRDAAAVAARLMADRPDFVFLPASLTHVDYCESHESESFAVNVAGVLHVVQAAATIGARIVYFSSDYVFAGDAGPYREGDPVNPLGVYARHKVEAERALPAGALTIRTTVVYGYEAQRKNFVYRLRRVLSEGGEMKVPIDQVSSPTYAPNLARAAVALANAGAKGIFHVAGPVRVNRYELALEAARVFGLDLTRVLPVTTAEFGQSAQRPLDAGFVTDKAQHMLAFPLIDYRAGLRALRDLEAMETS
jgi:dTDP-4-dehydrorhamnose reductase